MSRKNPTPLEVGRTGTLDGQTWMVIARVVLSVEIEGEKYFWNEYQLGSTAGAEQTLVFEEEETGPSWKRFEAFTPRFPLSAAEAALRREGDTVAIDGANARVTLVSSSTVEYVEGDAPAGMGIGAVARYFNATTGDEMIVVSWTGDEVEFFRGRRISHRAVESGFNFPRTAEWRRWISGSASQWGKAAGYALWFSLIVLRCCDWGSVGGSSYRAPDPPARQTAPPRRAVPLTGFVLAGRTYTSIASARLKIDEPRHPFGVREYLLRASDGAAALLVNGLTGDEYDWVLLRPIASPLTGFEAAEFKKGQRVMIGGEACTIAELFMERVADKTGDAFDETWPDAPFYGFIARNGEAWFLARWNERRIDVYRGDLCPRSRVEAALGSGASP